MADYFEEESQMDDGQVGKSPFLYVFVGFMTRLIDFSAVVSLCDRKEQRAVFQCQSAVKKDERNIFTVKEATSMQH